MGAATRGALLGRRGAAIVLALALLAAACSGGGGETAPTFTAFRGDVDSGPTTTGPLVEPEVEEDIVWYRCRRVFECATFEVPTVYRDPARGTTHLTIQRIPATDKENRIGVLLVNPGGPGGSGIDFTTYAYLAFPPEILARFDIVGFDPRGVGESGQVDCIRDADMEQLMLVDWADLGDERRAEVEELLDEIATRCFREHPNDLPYLGTVNAARDMDMIRRALGEEQISYVGFSYGTKLGAVYATLYPEHVRAMVLDGALVSGVDTLTFSDQRAAAFDEAYASFAAACAADATCPIEGDPVGVLHTLLDDLAAAPVTVESADGRQLTRSIAVSAIGSSLYGIGTWPLLAEAIGAAASGRAELLLELGDQSWGRTRFESFGPDFDAFLAIDCADRTDRPDIDDLAEDIEAQQAAHPLLGADQLGFALMCAQWPAGFSPVPDLDGKGAPPAMVIGTTKDPATPFAWAAALAEDLGNAVMVRNDGDGHTSFPWSPCMTDLVVPYLLDVTVPGAGAGCASTQVIPPFGFSVDDLINALIQAGVPQDGAVCLAEGLSGELDPSDLILLLIDDELDERERQIIEDVAFRCIEELSGL